MAKVTRPFPFGVWSGHETMALVGTVVQSTSFIDEVECGCGIVTCDRPHVQFNAQEMPAWIWHRNIRDYTQF